MSMGRERVKSLSNEFGTMLSQSTASMVKVVRKTSDNDTVRKYLLSGGKILITEATEHLKKLHTDTTVVLLELLDSSHMTMLSYSEADSVLQSNLRVFWKEVTKHTPQLSDQVGTMFNIDSSIYFPVITAISGNDRPLGYLVSWRLLATRPQAVEQISKLMGKGAVLFILNNDGSLWTDMRVPVSHVPVDKINTGEYLEYQGSGGSEVIGVMQPVKNSNWQVMIEFSKRDLLESADVFLRWLLIIGSLLIVVCILIARRMSRNITKPLDQLTTAAMAVSNGDYSVNVEVNKTDELGKLADAFNTMKEQVHTMQLNLEQKVKTRTIELESVNRELEAFSYSVSHDLRAPLRAVLGFTKMLEDKYAGFADEEAKRFISVIKTNAVQMGELIDDLLDFSRMGRHDIEKQNIPTADLVKDVIAGLETGNHINWHIQHLPDTYGDLNTMRQAWVNLVSNAVKYSGKITAPKIEIGSFRQEGETVFFVKDNGVGFDPKYKDKLFKVFQRLHNVQEFEGTGVGLAIVEKIISKHGGRVWAEAEKNNGACFYFSMPDGNTQHLD